MDTRMRDDMNYICKSEYALWKIRSWGNSDDMYKIMS